MTSVATIPRKAQKLINWLKTNNGTETSTFEDSNGNPDLESARIFAEKMRELHKDYVDTLITIEQTYHRVRITIVT
jgi:hypothetical protein